MTNATPPRRGTVHPTIPTPTVSVTCGQELTDAYIFALVTDKHEQYRLAAGVDENILLATSAEADTTGDGGGITAADAHAAAEAGVDGLDVRAENTATPEDGEVVATQLGTVTDRALRGTGAQIAARIRTIAKANPEFADRVVEVRCPQLTPEQVQALTIGIVVGSQEYTTSHTPAVAVPAVVNLVVATTTTAAAIEVGAAVANGQVLGTATALAKDLANAPSNLKTPAWLALTAVHTLDGIAGVSTRIRTEKWLEKKDFGGILAVGGGSANPPRLLEITYAPENLDVGEVPHIVLVGKGITYDSGGYSLKPAEGMVTMRTDMGGGAAVIAAIRAIAQLGLKAHVSALVPMSENMVSGTAYRPGDIVEQYDGTTVEIGNTDAEGRLVLADALGYAVAKRNPDILIDVATLTGAAKLALGMRTAAVLGTSDELVARVIAAGDQVGEAFWQLPLPRYMEPATRSTQADIRQAPKGPGAITAALFLKHFTGDIPWVHLDIAGPGRAEAAYDEVTPVGTGFAARTLIAVVSSLVHEQLLDDSELADDAADADDSAAAAAPAGGEE